MLKECKAERRQLRRALDTESAKAGAKAFQKLFATNLKKANKVTAGQGGR